MNDEPSTDPREDDEPEELDRAEALFRCVQVIDSLEHPDDRYAVARALKGMYK